MTDKAQQENLLGLLERHELMFAALYGAFSKALPDMAAFWQQLVREERAHAEVIRLLAENKARGEIRMKKLRVAERSVEQSIAEVQDHTRSAASSGITPWEALKLSLALEQRMLEKEFFQVFEADTDEIRSEFAELRRHTAEHAARIEQQMAALTPIHPASSRDAGGSTPPPAQPPGGPSAAGDLKPIVEAQTRIIRMLIEAETAMAELYELYARTYEDLSDFWQKLSAEEHSHARLLDTMFRFLQRGSIFYNIGRFELLAIQGFVRRVRTEIASTRRAAPSRKQALALAISLEDSLMDGHFYNVVKSDAPEFQTIARHLSQDTQRHTESVRAKARELHDPFV